MIKKEEGVHEELVFDDLTWGTVAAATVGSLLHPVGNIQEQRMQRQFLVLGLLEEEIMH